MSTSKGDIIRWAKDVHLTVETQAPGDGIRRYYFYNKDGYTVFGALGISEAQALLFAYRAGRESMVNE